MRAIIGLITFVLFLFCSPVIKSAFAAISITSVSPTVINSQEDIISLTATASGLSSSTQYLQVVFTKEGEATNYFGLTNNQQGEWYKYKSSPSLAGDLQVYFYSFTPVGGAWTGTISAKLDTGDNGFKGIGNYIIKLAKYITSSSPTYSANQYTVTVNIAIPTPTLTPTPTPTLTPTPTPPPTKTPTSTPIPAIGLAVSSFFQAEKQAFPTSILGESTQSAISKTSDKEGYKNPKNQLKVLSAKSDVIVKMLISFGVILLISCGILFFRLHIKNKEDIK